MSIHTANHLQLVSSEKKLSLQLFGPFCLRDELGQKITISSKKSRVLLAVVAFRGEISRRELARLLWSRHADEHALTSLRQALSKLKSSLGYAWPRLFVVGRHSVKLHENVACDLRLLMNTQLLDAAREQLLSQICRNKLFEGMDHKDRIINGWLDDARKNFASHTQKLIQNRINDLGDASATGNLSRDAQTLARLYVVADTNIHTDKGTEMDLLCEKYVRYLAEKVEYFWVMGVVKRSQQGSKALQLRKVVQVSYTHNITWDSAFHGSQNIVSAYKESRGCMVVLGESESGRTTLMLNLLVELLRQTERDKHRPVPVVLNVAQWSGSSLLPWLKKELAFRYDLPSEVVGTLFSAKRVALFLEGIDELPQQLLGAFVHESNVLCQAQPGLCLSVFCQEDALKQAKIRFKLNSTYKIMTPYKRTLFTSEPAVEHMVSE